MDPVRNDKDSSKLHGDKLEPVAHEHPQTVTSTQNAADLLEIPPHEQPQTDGGTKLHGDKLEAHGGKQS